MSERVHWQCGLSGGDVGLDRSVVVDGGSLAREFALCRRGRVFCAPLNCKKREARILADM